MPPLRPSLRAAPFLGLLFILPFSGTVAFRLLCLLGVLIVTALEWRKIRFPPTPVLQPYLGWAVLALIATILSTDLAVSTGEFKNEIGYVTIALIGFLGFVRAEADLDLALDALAVSALAMVGLATFSKLQGGPWPTDSHHGGVGDYSSYFVYIAPLLVWWLWRRSRPWLYVVVLPIAALIFFSILWSGNRMAFVSFAVELMVAAWLLLPTYRRRLYALIMPLLVIGALYIVVSLSPSEKPDATGYWQKTQVIVTTDVRWQIWDCAASRIAASPWFGAGFGRNISAQALDKHCDAEWSGAYHAHNVFLDAGLQVGVAGIVILAWLFFAIGRQFWRHAQSPHAELRQVGIVGLVFLVGLISKNQTDDFLIRHHSLLFWSLIGLLLGYARLVQARDLPGNHRKPPA